MASRPRLSLVQDSGHYASSCGYCGTRATEGNTSWSHGMMAEVLTPEAYQDLIDRGWRRSGRWLYQPINERTCCQLITIRLNVHNFRPNKEQRRAMRKWEEFLKGNLPLPLEQLRPHPHQHPPEGPHQGLLQHPDGVQFPVPADAELGARSSLSMQDDGISELAGTSPKRLHEDLEQDSYGAAGPSGISWGSEAGLDGAPSKRARGADSMDAGAGPGWRMDAWEGAGAGSEGDGSEGCGLEGGSPTAWLASQMQHVLRSPQPIGASEGDAAAGGADGPQHAPPSQAGTHQQPEQRGGSAGTEPAQPSESALAESLAVALRCCVSEQQLPGPAAANYPSPKVHRPSAKQRKVLPADVAYTSAYPLAVAAAAARAASGGGSSAGCEGGASPPPSAAAVAELLAQRAVLPPGVAVDTTDQGHLNFRMLSGSMSSTPSNSSARAPQQQQRVACAAGQQGRGSGAAAGGDAAPAVPSHAAQGGQASGKGSVPRGVQRHFELRMVRSDATVVPLEFGLYKKYQVMHHGDQPSSVTTSSFKRFLCDSPLRHAPQSEYPPGAAPACGFGSFHQQYWLDGRLVAVGVVDVLPRCLSSVYLFWDPDLGPLSLGKVSALKEIEWVAGASAQCPALRYYYLGFYLHNCHRMRYKGDYAPSDVLCPKSKCWVPLDRCRQALQQQPGMVALSELPGALDGLGEEHLVAQGRPMLPPAQPNAQELDAVRLYIPQLSGRAQVLTLRTLAAADALSSSAERTLRQRLAEWAGAVGPCWHSILYHV